MLEKSHIKFTGLFSAAALILWMALSSTSSSGCASRSSGDQDKTPRAAGQLYENYCASCHGMYMERFAGEDRQAMFAMPQNEMEEIIREGDYESGMPAFGEVFSEEEIEAVAEHILTDIKEEAGSHEYRPGFPEVVETEALSFRIDTVASGLGIPWGMAWLPNNGPMISFPDHLVSVTLSEQTWKGMTWKKMRLCSVKPAGYAPSKQAPTAISI